MDELLTFEQLYERHYNDVFGYVRRRVDDPHLAEDLAQTTFLRALPAFSRYSDQGKSPRAWLFTIARNLISDHFTHHYQRHVTKVADVTLWDSIAPLVDRTEHGPDEVVADREAAVLLYRLLYRMSVEQRQLLMRYYLQPASLIEVAAELGIEVNALKSRLVRALGAARRELHLMQRAA